MEKETILSPPLTNMKTIDETLEFIFATMIRQGEMAEAVEFIQSIESNFLPSKTIMKTLIFDILMKNDNNRTLAYTSRYLSNLIDIYVPREGTRDFYFDSIRGHGVLEDLSQVLIHIVHSYFCNCGIYLTEDSNSDPIRYPNCEFLLQFFIKLFSVDFEYYNRHNVSSCLIMKLFWPNSDVSTICLTNRNVLLLLKWINDIYASAVINESGEILEKIHQMLTLVIRCIIEKRHNLSQCAAFKSNAVLEIVESIINFCKEAFSCLSHVKKFLCFVPMLYLRAKISEKLIKQILKSSKKQPVLTLKDIVDICMFPSRSNKVKKSKPVTKERPKRIDKKYFADMKMETTKLHDLCKKNRFADLLEELKFSPDLNARDPAGNTPLHVACSVGSKICVRNLIDESSKIVFYLWFINLFCIACYVCIATFVLLECKLKM